MTRVLPIVGWLLVAAYFGVVLKTDYVIISDLYYPEGPWPGWWPFIEANAMYGGGGVLVVLLVRLVWRRWKREMVGRPIPSV